MTQKPDPKDQARIDEKIKEINLEFERYYLRVYLQIGLMDFLDRRRDIGFRLVSCDRTMKATKPPSNRKLKDKKKMAERKPDIILQNAMDTKGILIEVKSGYPWNDMSRAKAIEADIMQIDDYDSDVAGWVNVTDVIDEYCIVLMPYYEPPSKGAMTTLQELLRESKIKLRHPFAIWYWMVDVSQKSVGDVIQISCENPVSSVGWKLGACLIGSMIQIQLNALFSKYDEDKMRFSREPPRNGVYTIVTIYNVMGRMLRKGPEKKIICTVDEIMNLAAEYLPAWIPDDGKNSQLRKPWVRDALEMLANVGLAKKYSDGETYEWIELKRSKNFQGDLTKRVAEYEVKGRRLAMLSVDGVESTSIDDFL